MNLETILKLAKDAKERAEKATPGPWLEGGPYPGVSVCIEIDPSSGYPDPEPPMWDTVAVLDQRKEGEVNPTAMNDAAFIAASRTDVPELCRAVEVLAAALKDCSSYCQYLEDQNNDEPGTMAPEYWIMHAEQAFAEAAKELEGGK